MYAFIVVIHVIACVVLIAVILLQAGRGGGLSEAFGGGSAPQTIFGTKTTTFMTRATTICAILFLLTCLSLGILSTRRGMSLMEIEALQKKKADLLKEAFPSKEELPAPEETETPSVQPEEESTPVPEEAQSSD